MQHQQSDRTPSQNNGNAVRSVRRWSATAILSWGFSLFAAGAFGAVAVTLLVQSWPAWKHEGANFLTGTQWFYRQDSFGAAPMIFGSIAVALVALAAAAPVGIGAAVFAVEFLPPRLRLGLKVGVELLAGIPSVVYGLLGILILRDWVYEALAAFDPLSGDTLLTAGVLLAVMILPTIMTLSDDALRGVPSSQRMAARGLGLTATETVFSVSLPQAFPGLLAAVLLALGRALGEMIAVFLVVGRQDNQWPVSFLSLRPLAEAGQTLASKLGSAETNIAYGAPLHWGAMMGLALVLLGLVLFVVLAATWLRRLRQQHL
ncbi:MAG: phosphate ABC transporter permease subunit PstC [Verrucomicrobiales bacterium]|nr:phosphate ABC transporter permease subunit PstC [Verrucomicrobiales bacterium]